MDPAFSVELCGGTHVDGTGMIGVFAIISESAVASGIRRIEALTGAAALRFFSEKIRQSKMVMELLKSVNPIKAIEDLIHENSVLKKELEKAVHDKVANLKETLLAQAEMIGDLHAIVRKVDLPNADAIKNLSYALRDSLNRAVIVLAAELNGKPFLSVMISDELVKEKNLHAGNMIRELAKEIGGGGGGQPFLATAGGKNLAGIQQALAKAKSIVQ
jgi:alanyl-tRNA synthetase